jgi:hypothetical protein
MIPVVFVASIVDAIDGARDDVVSIACTSLCAQG